LFPLKDNIPTRRPAVITMVIIAINVVVFFGFQHAHWDGSGFAVSEKVTVNYAAIPYEITHPGKHCDETTNGGIACEGQPGVTGNADPQPATWLTVFTAMFMHGGLLHIAGNMLFLWIFGNNVEDSMGRPRFVAFYLLGGLAAMAGQTLIGPNEAVPTLGASGAIAAVLGGYALLYPKARVVTVVFIIIFFTILELPALLVLGAWFVLQLLPAVSAATQPSGGAGGGVAYFAHIGGFLFGLLLIRLFANRVDENYDRRNRIPVY
jgi:membrane associated rhomboid family serine protease